MKMGEIRVRPDGGFAMMTPGGIIRDVTLRCTVTGTIEVEEVSEGVLSTRALTIGVLAPSPTRANDPISSDLQAAAARIRNDSTA